MRLIDEDLLIERIYEYQSKVIDTEDVIHSIKTMPTAYDVEKVVEEVQNVHLPLASQTARIVGIIRKGGVE